MKKKILISLTIIWVLFIYFNSLQQGVESEGYSSAFAKVINQGLNWLGINLQMANLIYLIRKSAHIFEYFILSTLFTLIYLESQMSDKYKILYSFTSALLIAITDEVIQSFVPGRYGSLIDVLIDSIGIVIGVGLIILIQLIRKKKHNLHD
jgi:VanZ family protein